MQINTQNLEYNIYILINDKPVECNVFNCSMNLQNKSRIKKKEEKKLNDTNLFVIEKYSDVSQYNPEINKERDLINSIHEDLCPTQNWLQGYIKNTIPHSSFTIFINDKSHSSYYPLCIATITKLFDVKEYYDEDEYEARYESIPYLCINTFCGNSKYCRCASHLMNSIKMITLLLNCKYIQLHSINDEHTLEWYDKQGFKMDTDGLHNYIPKKKDLIYKRSKIEGNCVIKSTSRSPVKSSSSASRKKKYSVPLNRKKITPTKKKNETKYIYDLYIL
jgi:hypothetical protein